MTIIYELQLVVQFVRVLYMFYAQLLETIENKIVAGFSLKKKNIWIALKRESFIASRNELSLKCKRYIVLL